MQRDEEQDALLAEATTSVRQSAFYMKRAMDNGSSDTDIALVLKHAADFLRELRTSLLSPKNYYELYMLVADELRELMVYIESAKDSVNLGKMYDQVQSSGNVVPRMYLLVTVGVVYMRSDGGRVRDLLRDLVEMVKGVQHPLRGLFLRHYLVVSVKELLGQVPVTDALSFLLQNWDETNRLWIRMQFQSNIKDKKQREKERQELKVLVGTSLVRMSQLDDVSAAVYTTDVLPKVLEIIVNCKDKIAQVYLMDCVIQVFPDDFHLQTIPVFLAALAKLNVAVDVSEPVLALLQRLTKHHQANAPHGFAAPDALFETLVECAATAVTTREATLPSASLLALYAGIMEFVLACFPAPTTYLAPLLTAATDFLVRVKMRSDAVVAAGERLLAVPMDALGAALVTDADVTRCATTVLQWLPPPDRKRVALRWGGVLLRRRQPLPSADAVDKAWALLLPLIRDDADEPPPPTSVTLRAAFEKEQHIVARLAHLLDHPEPAVQFQMFGAARRVLGQGGLARIRLTLVPLVFRALELARRVHATPGDVSAREVLQFVHEMATALASKVEVVATPVFVGVFLQSALAADRCGLETIATEFFTQACLVYEDQLAPNGQQLTALEAMVGALGHCEHLASASADALATKLTQFAARVPKKRDQCRLVAACAHLFWRQGNGVRVLECLQRALKIADGVAASSPAQVALFVEILDEYLYFFLARTPEITKQYVAGLIALVKEHLENMPPGPEKAEIEAHYRNSLKHIETVELYGA
ncbi:vacuolar protein sorting-associated protein 35 [Achlya hypogyna]|uniref:Vacuolar protein sorting-associated protein 35 n=1 Tax=Achlya hypogyna TaxID=1202772 RepID=A0A1V9ZKH4_ACHHY|nr:vacuolar protein sorting-associated protein 35 [Achlya hypogyna]